MRSSRTFIYLFIVFSVCLPTVLIPIIKLSTSPNILSKEFTPSIILQVTCWTLTLIVIAFDIFLFVKHATDLVTSLAIGITGTIYIIFLIYLTWKPLEVSKNGVATSTEDGWMRLPQHEELVEDQPAIQRRRNDDNDDSDEIYAL